MTFLALLRRARSRSKPGRSMKLSIGAAALTAFTDGSKCAGSRCEMQKIRLPHGICSLQTSTIANGQRKRCSRENVMRDRFWTTCRAFLVAIRRMARPRSLIDHFWSITARGWRTYGNGRRASLFTLTILLTLPELLATGSQAASHGMWSFVFVGSMAYTAGFRRAGSPCATSRGILHWNALTTDIDDRKKAEEALKASERNLSLMINA